MNTEPNKPSATPETDGVTLKAQPGGMVFYDTVPAEFARRLERERDEQRQINDILEAKLNDLREEQDKLQDVCFNLMSERDEKMAGGAEMHLGTKIIEAVVRSDAIEKAITLENGNQIFVWRSNAAEQIEAALEEVTNAQVELPPNGGINEP